MKGFIEVHTDRTRLILPADKIAVQEFTKTSGCVTVEVIFNGEFYSVTESLTEIIAKIEAAQGEQITAEVLIDPNSE